MYTFFIFNKTNPDLIVDLMQVDCKFNTGLENPNTSNNELYVQMLNNDQDIRENNLANSIGLFPIDNNVENKECNKELTNLNCSPSVSCFDWSPNLNVHKEAKYVQ